MNGSNGFVLNGIDIGDASGGYVSRAGDINGDGLDDLVIGANGADPNGNSRAGETYVVFGKTSGFSASMELSGLNGTNGFVLNGIDTDDFSGISVGSAGDVNGDGVDDLLIGSGSADPNGSDSGEVYVIFGNPNGFLASIELSGLNGSNGFVINGVDAEDYSGVSVSEAGDVNGDGIDDLLIGASGADPNGNSFAGKTYVVFGKTNSFSSSMELSSLDGSNGFVLNGIDPGDYSGQSVSATGDVNGDGLDDFLIGAISADPNGDGSGETYVVFGKLGGFPSSMELSSLDGSHGFTLIGIDPYDYSGRSVSAAGDVNGDGVDDLLIGAYTASPNGISFAGETYVVFGIQGAVAPTIANAIPDQSATEDQAFSFTIPVNTFADINVDDAHILSATLDSGGTLPPWLTFDVGTRTFTGTPTNDDVGTISIEVTATDEDNLFVSDNFDLQVINVNDAPVLAAIGAQNGDESTQITFTASATDIDLPVNMLTFSLDATSLDKGMVIDANSGAFSWTPTEAQSGGHEVTVTVSDGTLTDSETVVITVNRILGIDKELASAIEVYPNPIKNEFLFTLENDYIRSIMLHIVDINGHSVLRQIIDKTAQKSNSSIDISGVDSGIYFLEIYADGNKSVIRLIKK